MTSDQNQGSPEIAVIRSVAAKAAALKVVKQTLKGDPSKLLTGIFVADH